MSASIRARDGDGKAQGAPPPLWGGRGQGCGGTR